MKKLPFNRVGHKCTGFWRNLFCNFVCIHVSAVFFDNITSQKSHFIIPTALGQSQTKEVFQSEKKDWTKLLIFDRSTCVNYIKQFSHTKINGIIYLRIYKRKLTLLVHRVRLLFDPLLLWVSLSAVYFDQLLFTTNFNNSVINFCFKCSHSLPTYTFCEL